MSSRSGCHRSTTAIQSVGFPSPLKIRKSLPTTPMLPRKRNIGRPPQAGAAAHACTDSAARKASAETSGLCATLLPFPRSRSAAPGIRTAPAARRSRKAKQGGAGGIISPALPFRGPGRGPGCSGLSLSSFLPFLLQKRRRGAGHRRRCRIRQRGYSPSFHSLWTRATTSSTADCFSGGQTTMRGLPASTFFVWSK